MREEEEKRFGSLKSFGKRFGAKMVAGGGPKLVVANWTTFLLFTKVLLKYALPKIYPQNEE